MTEKRINLDNQSFTAKRLDKVLFPGHALTKGDLIAYYKRIAPTMLPYMKERPLTMQRFPDGIEAGGFYQKEAPDYFPDWIQRTAVRVQEDDREQEQLICNNAAALLYLANQACITPHIWLSRAGKLDYPDKLIFDLDPPTNEFDPVRRAARDLRDLLQEIDLASFVMTTGSQGLHVVVPLDRRANFDTVRDFAHNVAEHLAKRHPHRLTAALNKEKRQGKLFLDYLRNAYGQNSVTPYAVRPLPGAPVATPLDWNELDKPQLHAQSYNMDNIFRRLGQKDDPWQDMMGTTYSLDEVQGNLRDLLVAE